MKYLMNLSRRRRRLPKSTLSNWEFSLSSPLRYVAKKFGIAQRHFTALWLFQPVSEAKLVTPVTIVTIFTRVSRVILAICAEGAACTGNAVVLIH